VSEVTATILEQLPNALYRVRLDNQQQALAHAAGTVQRNFVRLLPGDRVGIQLSPRDWTRGRITRRITGPAKTAPRPGSTPRPSESE
jgi:translation initiation factor IF-1